MKTISLLFLLLSLNSFGQKRTWEYASRMQSGFYQSDSCFVVFEATKGEQDVKVKCKIIKTPILSPIFIFTKKGQFITNHEYVNLHFLGTFYDYLMTNYHDCVPIYFRSINQRGFSQGHLFLRNKNQWESLDSGITEIRFFSGKKWYYVKINDNINKLKQYANEKHFELD